MHFLLNIMMVEFERQYNNHLSFDFACYKKAANQTCDVILFRLLINVCLAGGPWAECERVTLTDFSATEFMQMTEHLPASRVN